MLKIVMFDNDGTLVDSEKLHFDTIGKIAIDHFNVTISHKDWWEHCSGAGHQRIWKWLCEKSQNENVPDEIEFITACKESYTNNLSELKAKPGIEDILKLYRENHTSMCVVSSSPTEVVQAGLTATGLKKYFDGDSVFGVDHKIMKNKPKKPEPDPYIIAGQHFDVNYLNEYNSVVYEDSDNGCKAGFKANSHVIQTTCHESFNHTVANSLYAHKHVKTGAELFRAAHQTLQPSISR